MRRLNKIISLVWHQFGSSVKMLGWEETNDIVLTALNAITGKDTRDTWHCSCLVPNVCASVKALTACICGIHSAGCFLFIKLVWNAIDFTVKVFSPWNKHTRYRIQCCAKKVNYLKAGVKLPLDFIALFLAVLLVKDKFSTIEVNPEVSLAIKYVIRTVFSGWGGGVPNHIVLH